MDLSPKLLTEVEFPEQWRGYNQNQVDEFLERVAIGVGELQRQLAEALERATAAERKLLDRSDEDEIRRTLVLAQRTATATVEEAKAEATRLVSDAERRADALIAEAEASATALDQEIAERRRAELGGLSEQRAGLQRDIESLRQFVDAERARLAEELRMQLTSLQEGYAVGAAPAVSDVPPLVPETEATSDDVVVAGAEVEPAPPPPPRADTGSMDELRGAREELADALRQAGVEPLPLTTPAPVDATASEDDDDVRWRSDEHGDDPFLAELRRAVTDDEPLGPRDHEPPAGDHDDEADDAGGLFRRGRRGR